MRLDACSRRAWLVCGALNIVPPPALTPLVPPALAAEPSPEAVVTAKRAFKAFDDRNLQLADELFSETIAEWRRLDRGVEELTALLVARAGVSRSDSTCRL